MKTRRTNHLRLLLAAVLLTLGSGCVQDVAQSAGTDAPDAYTTAVEPAPTQLSALDPSPAAAPALAVAEAPVEKTAANATQTDAPAGEPAIVGDDVVRAPATPVSTEPVLPPTIKPNGAVGEIIRLTESGVDQGVMLAYVTNSPNRFNLAADEIIYLNDIGVPSQVVTAMIQRDQALTPGPTHDWPAQTNEIANAQPPPSEYAPQGTAPEGPTEAAAPPPSATPTESSFYSDLAPYGTWVNVDGYGMCWQPTVVVSNPGWQPYYDYGHWVYSDSGWYWYSGYSWGWAPFHYGRWFRHSNLGWCWMPGYVWGPSWVTWRYSNAYCGWAPLPPAACYRPGFGFSYYGSSVGVGFSFGLSFGCYSFVGWNHFHDGHHHYYDHHDRAPHDQARRVYAQSVPVTRIEGNGGRVVNRGITPEKVAEVTHRPVRQVAVREVSAPTARGVRSERLSNDGRSVTVYRPRIPEPSRTQTLDPAPVARAATTRPTSTVNSSTSRQVRETDRPLSRPIPARSLAMASAESGQTTAPTVQQNPGRSTSQQSRAARALPPTSSYGNAPQASARESSTHVVPTEPGGARPNYRGAPNRADSQNRWPSANPATPAASAPSAPSANQPMQRQNVTPYAPAPSRSALDSPRYATGQDQLQQRQYTTPGSATYQTPTRTAPATPQYNAPTRSLESPRYSNQQPAAQAPQVQQAGPNPGAANSVPQRSAPVQHQAPSNAGGGGGGGGRPTRPVPGR